jgi:hypothetical protein
MDPPLSARGIDGRRRVGVYWTTGTRGTLTSKGEPKNYGSYVYAAATYLPRPRTRTRVLLYGAYAYDTAGVRSGQVRSVSGPPSHRSLLAGNRFPTPPSHLDLPPCRSRLAS